MLEAATDRAVADAIDPVVRAAVERASIPGLVVAVLRRGVVAHHAAHGVVSLELGVPAALDSVFPLASITKVFTATLAMRQVEDGALALDAPIAAHLAALPPAWGGVTPRQLLAHTSGLPDVLVDPMAGTWLAETRDEALAAAFARPMDFAPGTAWAYNQTNYVLLGALVERLGGAPLEAQLEAAVLRPLGMASTSYGDARVVVPGRGPWYSRIDFSGPVPRRAERIHPIWVTYPAVARPCAALNATALDLARFVDAVAAGRILSPATVAAMWQPQLLRDGAPAGPDPTSGMGLGWIVEADAEGGRTLVGGSGGATSAFRHAVGEGLTVVVLTNCQGGDPDGLATAIALRLLGAV